MNKNQNIYYDDAVPLNLLDMMFSMLKRWKVLIVMLVLGAVLGGAFGKSGEAGTPVTVTEEMVRGYSIPNQVKANMEKAAIWRNFYAQQQDYNQNSLFMKMNANSAYIGSLQYYVEAGNETELAGIALEEILNEGEVISQLVQVFGGSYEEKYVLELISAWTGDSDKDSDSTVSTDVNVTASLEEHTGVLVNYKIYGLDQDSCSRLMDVIRNRVQQLSESYGQTYEGFICRKVADRISLKRDVAISNLQRDGANLLCAYQNDLVNIENMFTPQQWDYYKLVYLHEPFVERTVADEETKTGRLIGTGMLIGLILWLLYCLVRYLTDKHIKYAQEVQSYFGLPLVGRYRDEDKPVQGVEKLEERVTARKYGDCIGKEYLVCALNLLERPLFLSGDFQEASVEKLLKDIAAHVTGNGCGDLLRRDSTALQKAKEAGNIILFLKKGSATHTGLKKELELCHLQGISVAGVVVVE